MRETSIIDNFNFKVQAHARLCEENNELEEKMTSTEKISW